MRDPYAGWARLYNPLAEPWLRPFKGRIVRLCAAADLSRVLDVGTGTGTLCGFLAKEGMATIGLDPSPSMLRIARRSAAGCSLIRGRGELLPLASGSSSGVIMSLVLHENDRAGQQAMIHEALRAIAPNGALFILDYRWPEQGLGKIVQRFEYGIERLVGGQHFANYRRFMESGALPSMLTRLLGDAWRYEPLLFGTLGLAAVSAQDLCHRNPPAGRLGLCSSCPKPEALHAE
jgi:ubiquinone/menaquinone biosynthesis C-methylase UbiE